ncbi:signal transduction histidine kinase [Azospirillum agricola]|uniref:PAS domain-containing sensor histidine kinase n=1 Tax=Azospirillum agricola TaxID=1720247 RepID=UPI001AE5954A|nr:PAS-domain containing protein [Azospirillum agricola]MBP2227129.1 signal transduction histidine kinase [Azospirillum agricola]
MSGPDDTGINSGTHSGDGVAVDELAAPASVQGTIDRARRYREQVLSVMPGVIIHQGGQQGGKILHCTEPAALLLGYGSAGDVLALPGILALIPEDTAFADRHAYEQCLAGVVRADVRRIKRRHADGSVQWFDQLLEPVDWGGAPAVLETLAQVRPHTSYAQMPHQWQLLQAAIDAMPNGVLMLDRDRRMEGANSEFLRLWDYPPGLFPPGTPMDVMLRYNHERGDYGDVPAEPVIAELASRFLVRCVINAERQVPSGRILDIRTAPRADGGYVVTHVDITDRKRIESELREAKERAEAILKELRDTQQQLIVQEKMASLGQLTAGIAHELKNPLNFVNNFAELSSELLTELLALLAPLNGHLDADARTDADDLVASLTSNLHKIADHGRRADNIVKSMLAHSRGGGGEWQSTDLNALVDEALSLSYHAVRAQDRDFNTELERRFDPAVASLNLVPQDISRVLVNLFTNAFYALRKRQQAETRPDYHPRLIVSTVDCGWKVEVKIRDNGTGMPQAVIAKLFTPFFTTKPTGEGTGLGLSLSYDIVVHQHRGRFDVTSAENDHTEFTITLPRAVPAVSLGERRKP